MPRPSRGPVCALAALAGASAAAAQEAPTVEAVVVTARGRAERLAEAPAVVAVASLEARGVQRLDDLANAVPGVFVIDDQDPGTNIASIRGVSTDRLQAASIAYVVDGVPLADTELFTERLYDVARNGRPLLEPGDVEEGLAAANAIGDDTLQRRGGGQVVPDAFTHGTSAQRVRWFRTGLENGDPDACDTFSARTV